MLLELDNGESNFSPGIVTTSWPPALPPAAPLAGTTPATRQLHMFALKL